LSTFYLEIKRVFAHPGCPASDSKKDPLQVTKVVNKPIDPCVDVEGWNYVHDEWMPYFFGIMTIS